MFCEAPRSLLSIDKTGRYIPLLISSGRIFPRTVQNMRTTCAAEQSYHFCGGLIGSERTRVESWLWNPSMDGAERAMGVAANATMAEVRG